MFSRRIFLGAAASAFLVSPWVCTAADAADITAPISAFNDGLISSMREGKATPFPQRFAKLAPLVDRAFDLQAILQASVGAKWSSLPPDQQQQLLTLFRNFTIATWVSSFSSYDGEQFELSPDLRPIGEEQVVQTRLVPAKGAATRFDYVMRPTPDGWHAVDILLDGSISRVAVQRSDFRGLLASGDAQPLIRSLQKKVTDLSGGTIPA
jgi:phospholipid transport system substrate-binding protein